MLRSLLQLARKWRKEVSSMRTAEPCSISQRRSVMKTTTIRRANVAVIAIAACLAGASAGLNAQEVTIGGTDLGGVVTGPSGPEAGVWVIAETTDLPTKFAKMVVTDDRGRYVIPDLPKAGYSVWVRGYGLADSQKVNATP